MRIKEYIQATHETLREGADPLKTLHNLKAYLSARGLATLYPRVLRGLVEKDRRTARARTTRIIVAREKDTRHAIKVAKGHEQALGDTHDHLVTVDPTLIGGLVIEKNGKRIDQSYKRALLEAYRRITR